MLSKLFKPKAPTQPDFNPGAGQSISFKFAATEQQRISANTQGDTVTVNAAVSRVARELAALRGIVAEHAQDRDTQTIQADIDKQRALLAVHTRDTDLAAGQVRTGTLTMAEAGKVMEQRDKTHRGLHALLTELQSRAAGDAAQVALGALLAQVK